MKLPQPDEYGNYWIGERGYAPAILLGGDEKVTTDGRTILKRQRRERGPRYFVTTQDGAIFDGVNLRYFSSARAALQALEKAVA